MILLLYCMSVVFELSTVSLYCFVSTTERYFQFLELHIWTIEAVGRFWYSSVGVCKVKDGLSPGGSYPKLTVAPSYFFSRSPPQLWYPVGRQHSTPCALDVFFPEAAPPRFWVDPGLGVAFISLQVFLGSRLLFANKPKLDSYPEGLGALECSSLTLPYTCPVWAQ